MSSSRNKRIGKLYNKSTKYKYIPKTFGVDKTKVGYVGFGLNSGKKCDEWFKSWENKDSICGLPILMKNWSCVTMLDHLINCIFLKVKMIYKIFFVISVFMSYSNY
ncbi:hypothetical protein H5410_046628 [Solanum commersonii]|uniref:Uncharacterized protein n=1 Tax=Solanum commersonii TaxID=4109 RepID=A0A9J5XEU1_SOLCO|nr:hypothetical protein H5410_046628 [Solanum commersonii]